MWQKLSLDPVPAVELGFAARPSAVVVVGLLLVVLAALLLSCSARPRTRIIVGRLQIRPATRRARAPELLASSGRERSALDGEAFGMRSTARKAARLTNRHAAPCGR
jgi:hypothetical protein